MPAEGIDYLPKKEVLTYEEMLRLISLLAKLGITKVRLTGGEPFIRKDLMKLIRSVVEVPGIRDLHLTTNGVLTAPFIPELKKLGIASVNLSLDTLDRERFNLITLRDEFVNTMRTLDSLIDHDIPVKVNAVVMEGKNIEDIIPLVELTRHKNISIRFIEEMPFNGEGSHYKNLSWNYKRILEHIRTSYPEINKITDEQNSTAAHYQVPGFKGNIGVIAAFSRTFCGTCNRLRITSQGTLKTCLYDKGVFDIKNMMRAGASDEMITEKLLQAFSSRPKDGFEAEKLRTDHQPVHESMSTIGG